MLDVAVITAECKFRDSPPIAMSDSTCSQSSEKDNDGRHVAALASSQGGRKRPPLKAPPPRELVPRGFLGEDPPPPMRPCAVLSKPPLKAPPPASAKRAPPPRDPVEIAEFETDPPPPPHPWELPSSVYCQITNRGYTQAEIADGLQARLIAQRPRINSATLHGGRADRPRLKVTNYLYDRDLSIVAGKQQTFTRVGPAAEQTEQFIDV